MGEDGSVLPPGWRGGRRVERLRMVDATIDGKAVVQTRKGEGKCRFWKQ